MYLTVSLVCLLALTSLGYETLESGVLQLHDSDFPSITENNEAIMLDFFASNCGYCRELEPIYADVGRHFRQKNSSVKLATINGDTERNSLGLYRVAAFPTIIFFRKGERIDYDGDRTRDGMINWINKKIRPLVSEISTQAQLDLLKDQDIPSLVLFTKNQQVLHQFKQMSNPDTNNRYYVAIGDLTNKYENDTVEMHRSFAETIAYKGIGQRFIWWRNKYSRPLVAAFDSNLVNSIFRRHQNAIIIFNIEEAPNLMNTVNEVAKDFQGDLLIAEIKPSNSQFAEFSAFLRINPTSSRIIGLNSQKQMKAVLLKPASKIDYLNLMEFITAVDKGQSRLYPTHEQVQIDESEQAEVIDTQSVQTPQKTRHLKADDM